MRFTPTNLSGVYLIDLEPVEDERGFIARTWCRREMEEHGLRGEMVQCILSVNRRRGTLRGMHYQAPPHAEVKIVNVSRGAIYDVALDLRSESPTYRRWVSAELTAANRRMLYIPQGCAHGYQTLQDDTELCYRIDEYHHGESARGVRYNDPAFGIEWPIGNPFMNERDRRYPDFVPETPAGQGLSA